MPFGGYPKQTSPFRSLDDKLLNANLLSMVPIRGRWVPVLMELSRSSLS